MNINLTKNIPVNIITGFLGSGKTTLIQKMLKFKGMKNSVIIVNEFGEVGIDHHLFEHIDENTVNGMIMKAREKWFVEEK